MKRVAAWMMMAGALAGVGGSAGSAEPPAVGAGGGAVDGKKWKMVWNDEFDGEALNPKNWDFDEGNGFKATDGQWVGGWGNNELEFYTRRADNVYLKQGMLHLRAVREAYNGFQYTSGRIKTRKADQTELFARKYGRFEIRAKLPTGRGLWPAIWLLPQAEKYGGWAASGEIDIMEARGQEPGKVLGTLHYGGRWPGNVHAGRDYSLPNGGTIADFHVYALEWEPGVMRWYVDDTLFSTQNFWWSSRRADGKGPAGEGELHPWPAPFDQPFFVVMNLAVGGNFLGNPDDKTVFPAEMVVDYVRVYDREGGYAMMPPRGEGTLPFEKGKKP